MSFAVPNGNPNDTLKSINSGNPNDTLKSLKVESQKKNSSEKSPSELKK